MEELKVVQLTRRFEPEEPNVLHFDIGDMPVYDCIGEVLHVYGNDAVVVVSSRLLKPNLRKHTTHMYDCRGQLWYIISPGCADVTQQDVARIAALVGGGKPSIIGRPEGWEIIQLYDPLRSDAEMLSISTYDAQVMTICNDSKMDTDIMNLVWNVFRAGDKFSRTPIIIGDCKSITDDMIASIKNAIDLEFHNTWLLGEFTVTAAGNIWRVLQAVEYYDGYEATNLDKIKDVIELASSHK